MGVQRMDSNSWRERTFRRMEPGSIRGSIFNLVATALGAGIITIGYGLARMGLLVGIVGLAICAAVSTMTTAMLVSYIKETQATCYSELMRKTFGLPLAIFTDVVLFFYATGAVVGYYLILTQFMSPVLTELFPFMGEWEKPRVRALIVVISGIAMLPLSCYEKLSSLATVSMISIVPLLFLPVILLVYLPTMVGDRTPEEWGQITLCRFSWDFFKANTIFFYAYNQHVNVCSVAEEMANPTDPRILKVAIRAGAVEYLVYLSAGVLGFLSFLDNTEDNVLKNFPSGEAGLTFVRIALSVGIILSIPINTIAVGLSGKNVLVAFFRLPHAPDSPQALSDPRTPVIAPEDEMTLPEGAVEVWSHETASHQGSQTLSAGEQKSSKQQSSNFVMHVEGTPAGGGDNGHAAEAGGASPDAGSPPSVRSPPLSQALLEASNQPPPDLEEAGGPGEGGIVEPWRLHLNRFVRSVGFRASIALYILLVAFVVSIYTDDLGTVIGLTSGLLATTIMTTFPLLLMLKRGWTAVGDGQGKPVVIAILCFFSALGYVSCVVIFCQAFGLIPSVSGTEDGGA